MLKAGQAINLGTPSMEISYSRSSSGYRSQKCCKLRSSIADPDFCIFPGWDSNPIIRGQAISSELGGKKTNSLKETHERTL
jgi:hypothetical protein